MRIAQDFDLRRLAERGTVAQVVASSTDSILVHALTPPLAGQEFRISRVDFELVYHIPVAQPCNA
ncbi:MAG: hypothetical protein PHD72_04245 [Patescibacteria group bacterium]|nr:hypothetical protein [Patescibacteria group bacterium]